MEILNLMIKEKIHTDLLPEVIKNILVLILIQVEIK